jgi:O-antigen/teichoic acid export membrane protein
VRERAWLQAVIGSVAAGGSLQLVVAASGILAARLLGVTGRGHLALVWVITLVIGQLSTLGLHVAIAYAVARGQPPRGVVYRVRWLIVAQLLLAPAVALPAELALFAGLRSEGAGVLVATLTVPPMFVLLLHGLAVVQGERRYRAIQLHRLVQPALYVVLLAALTIRGSASLTAVILGWALTMAIGGLFAWRQALGTWWPRRSDAEGAGMAPFTEAGAMMRFSLRSLFSAFGAVEHLQLDLLLTGIVLSARQFGLYTAGAAFANLPEFLGQSIGYIAYPEVTAAPAGARRRVIVRYVAIGVALIAPVVGALVLVMPWLLPTLFGAGFGAGAPVAQILLAGALLQAVRRVAAEGLRGLGSGVSASLAELAFVVVFLAALVPLSASAQARGAGLAFLLASAAAIAALAERVRR